MIFRYTLYLGGNELITRLKKYTVSELLAKFCFSLFSDFCCCEDEVWINMRCFFSQFENELILILAQGLPEKPYKARY
jgi:hypothetical protein